MSDENLCPDTQEAYTRVDKMLNPSDAKPVEMSPITPINSAAVEYARNRQTRGPRDLQKILDQILTAWAKAPYLRLGQLLLSANAYPNDNKADLFNTEDEVLVNKIRQFEQSYL